MKGISLGWARCVGRLARGEDFEEVAGDFSHSERQVLALVCGIEVDGKNHEEAWQRIDEPQREVVAAFNPDLAKALAASVKPMAW